MDYIDILNSKYFVDTYSKIEEMKKDFPVNHGFIHVSNVIKNAKRLAKTFNLSKKQENLLLIACALHDVGYLEGRDDHALKGSILVRKYLIEQDFNSDDISVICDAIKNHGGKEKSDFYEIVSMCLIISDKLDFISNRYNEHMLDDEKKVIFPHIIDTILDVSDRSVVLKIVVDAVFSRELFERGSYFNKLNNFLELLSVHLNKIYEIKYDCVK